MDLPILQWAKAQGAVVGFAHSGWGLEVKDTTIPTQEMPRFDGIGANEYIVDVTHDAVDFISTVDTPAPWELNIWYHTLNAASAPASAARPTSPASTATASGWAAATSSSIGSTTIAGPRASAADGPTSPTARAT